MSDVLPVLAAALGWGIKITGSLCVAMFSVATLWIVGLESILTCRGLSLGECSYFRGRCVRCGVMHWTLGAPHIQHPEKRKDVDTWKILEVFCCRQCGEAEAFKAAVK